jgi:ATP-dependent Clp protease ATP-binding subunit ClpA
MERMTDRSIRVMRLAQQEARRWNHEYVGCEHLLLAIFKESSGVAAGAMQMAGITRESLKSAADQIVNPGPHMEFAGDVAPSPRLTAMLGQANEEARLLNHNYIGTEHLLLALCRDQESDAAKILLLLGVIPGELAKQVMELLAPTASTSSLCQKLFDDCLAAVNECSDPEIAEPFKLLERRLRDVAESHGLKFNAMVECPGCSKAGGADRSVMHREPTCPTE